MRAIKDFRYFDFEKRESVQVRMGDQLDPSILARNKVDPDKMVRTKYAEAGEGVIRKPKPVRRTKRGG